MPIDGGDILSFFGGLVGAGGGILAANLAVHWQMDRQVKSAVQTIKVLVSNLRSTANELDAKADAGSSSAARAVYRAFCALRDVSIGVRTFNASIATLAARMEHTTVYPEIVRLIQAPENGIAAADARGRASEVNSLCDDLEEYFARP